MIDILCLVKPPIQTQTYTHIQMQRHSVYIVIELIDTGRYTGGFKRKGLGFRFRQSKGGSVRVRDREM